MIRLSKQLLLLQERSELKHCQLSTAELEAILSAQNADSPIQWAFEQAFFDEERMKLSLICVDAQSIALQPKKKAKGKKAKNKEEEGPSLSISLIKQGKSWQLESRHFNEVK